MNLLNPKKLLLTKWTAVKPIAKQKHFLISRLIEPQQLTDPIERVEIEAVFPKLCRRSLGVICKTTVCGGRVGTEEGVVVVSFNTTLGQQGW